MKNIGKRIRRIILFGTIADAAFLSYQCTTQWGFMRMMVGVYSFNRRNGKRIPADFDFVRIKLIKCRQV
jgi:hypothetical protein